MASIRTKVWLFLVWYIGSVECQTQDSRYYNRDYQDRYDNTYLYNNRRYGRPNYPGDDDYNRGYGGIDERHQVSSPSRCEKMSMHFAQRALSGILQIFWDTFVLAEGEWRRLV